MDRLSLTARPAIKLIRSSFAPEMFCPVLFLWRRAARAVLSSLFLSCLDPQSWLILSMPASISLCHEQTHCMPGLQFAGAAGVWLTLSRARETELAALRWKSSSPPEPDIPPLPPAYHCLSSATVETLELVCLSATELPSKGQRFPIFQVPRVYTVLYLCTAKYHETTSEQTSISSF